MAISKNYICSTMLNRRYVGKLNGPSTWFRNGRVCLGCVQSSMATFNNALDHSSSEAAWRARYDVDAAFANLAVQIDGILREPRDNAHRHVWIGISTASPELKDDDNFDVVWANVRQRWTSAYAPRRMEHITVVLVLQRGKRAAKAMEVGLLGIARHIEDTAPGLHVRNRARAGQGIREGNRFRMLYIAWADVSPRTAIPQQPYDHMLTDMRRDVGDYAGDE